MKTDISASLENYLETIAEIIEAKGHAHTKDIADRLKVKMPSVTSALQSLAGRGLINYESHAPVVLTASGAETAAVIRNRHTALRNFFQGVLKLDAADADAVACRVEHLVDERVISRLVALACAIGEREDAAGLREYLDNTMPTICTEAAGRMLPLDELRDGEQAVVLRVGETLRGVKRFADLGIVPGALLEMEGRAPLGGLLRIKLMGSSLSIRRRDAAHIRVRLTG